MGRASPFGALVAGLAADEFPLLREAVNERRCRKEIGVDTLAVDAEVYRPDPKCPRCGARGAWRDGSAAAGVPRWRCRPCGRRFNCPLTPSSSLAASSSPPRKAMGGRIAPGALLIHDLEREHNALARDGGHESEAHRADVTARTTWSGWGW